MRRIRAIKNGKVVHYYLQQIELFILVVLVATSWTPLYVQTISQ